MIRRSLLIIATITLTGSLYAQEQKSVLQLAEEAYAREEYAVAGALYQRQARKKGNKTPVALLLKIAHSYQEIGRFQEAADVYREITARPDRPAAAYFAYGEALRQLEQYGSAREQYSLFTTSNADSLQLKEIALRGCDSAAVWKRAAVQLIPVKELNTPGSDLVSGATGRGLMLMSNGYRELMPGGTFAPHPRTDLRTRQPYYRSYVYQQYTPGHATMQLEELVPSVLGKFNYNIGPVCMNGTEDTLYATINIQGRNVPLDSRKGPVNGRRQLQVWQSVKTGGKWQQMVLLPGINVAGYSSSHAVLNTAGNTLYFVSDRPGGFGQTDIWYAERQPDGSWSAPVNCGEKINTIAAETFPTINEGGILYFSSKGYAGLGGYDIYRVKGERSSWDVAENMKAPFNSGGDDIGLVLRQNSHEGYLASNKPGGIGGDDIYYFKDPDYYNRINHVAPTPAIDHSTQPATVPGRNVPSTAGSGPRSGPRQLTAEEEADKRMLEDLKFLYDFNSASLLAESRQMLDKAAEVLARHPNWKVVIASFADSRGTDQYNTDLSALRCFAVIDYLVNKGINLNRLYYTNKGELEPVNRCQDGVPCNEEEYRLNRRSELRVRW